MFFKKYFTNKSKNKNSTITEKPLNNSVEIIEANPISEFSTDESENQSFLGSSILFGKFKNLSSGPDVLFENEAWAPENEYVGLFRKRRTQVEEQTSLTSDS
ncbi:MAG: hypothetical protein ACYDEJ_00530 [Desulfitobacteriaceae bacterium]